MLCFSKALVPAFLSAVFAAGTSVPAFRPDDYLRHARFLAGDEMSGRGNGTPELNKAADYIAAGFEAAGLRPAADVGTCFQ